MPGNMVPQVEYYIAGATAPDRKKKPLLSVDSMLYLLKNTSRNYVDLFHIVNSCLIFCSLSPLDLLVLLFLKFQSFIKYVAF